MSLRSPRSGAVPLPLLSLVVVAALLVLSLTACSSAFVSGSAEHDSLEMLMPGTPYETPLYRIRGLHAGPTVLVIGGVHGDEPGGWQGAERLLTSYRPKQGTLLVIPRANRLAIEEGVRSTPYLGDLNRLYGATDFALPMASMAAEILRVVREYRVDVVLDMHESWQAYADRPATGSGEVNTGFIGQTISGHRDARSLALARRLVDRVNRGLRSTEDFHYFEYPKGYEEQTIVPLLPGLPEGAVPNRSGLEIASLVPGTASVTSEVNQQQTLERRIAQQVAIVKALFALLEKPEGLPFG